MPSSSETSFGARLFRAKTLHSYISNFSGYNPPRTQETAADLNILLDDITAINATESSLQQNYNTAVNNRYNAFRTDTISVFKLLAPIRAAVEAQFGKGSTEFNQIDSIVKKIRDAKLVRKPATDTTPETTISSSEQSYGSSTQYFNDIINTLSQLPNYNPSNVNIQVASLQTFATQLNTLNTQVATTYQSLRTSRHKRLDYYNELSERGKRIKAYVKANYGVLSQEYTLIKGLII